MKWINIIYTCISIPVCHRDMHLLFLILEFDGGGSIRQAYNVNYTIPYCIVILSCCLIQCITTVYIAMLNSFIIYFHESKILESDWSRSI